MFRNGGETHYHLNFLLWVWIMFCVLNSLFCHVLQWKTELTHVFIVFLYFLYLLLPYMSLIILLSTCWNVWIKLFVSKLKKPKGNTTVRWKPWLFIDFNSRTHGCNPFLEVILRSHETTKACSLRYIYIYIHAMNEYKTLTLSMLECNRCVLPQVQSMNLSSCPICSVRMSLYGRSWTATTMLVRTHMTISQLSVVSGRSPKT